MHQARKIVFLVLLAAALAGRAGAESPYRRSWSKDGWIAGRSASAVFLSTVYGDYHPGSAAGPYIWGGSLLAAAGVGFMRYESGKHFPTDIITGAVVGSAVGYLIPRIHRAAGDRLSLRPDFTGCRPGLALELRL